MPMPLGHWGQLTSPPVTGPSKLFGTLMSGTVIDGEGEAAGFLLRVFGLGRACGSGVRTSAETVGVGVASTGADSGWRAESRHPAAVRTSTRASSTDAGPRRVRSMIPLRFIGPIVTRGLR